MNADRVINKINIDMNAFNESGSREDKACAEGLRIARTYIQQEVLKRKILTHDQQVVLEWLKESCNADDYTTPMLAIYKLYSSQQMVPNLVFLTTEKQFQVLAAFAEWGSKEATNDNR